MAAEGSAAGEDSHISRTSISGLFDSRGNPAALASGWLQIYDAKSGRKRYRYCCLCPTYFAWFQDEADAEINEEGFMVGDADHASLSLLGSHGASVTLSNIYEAQAHGTDPSFTLVLRAGLEDGSQALEFHTANAEIAHGWSDAINSQKERYKDVRAPPRMGKPTAAGHAGGAAAGLAVASHAAAAAASSVGKLSTDAGKHAKAAVYGLFGMKTGDEPVKPDSEYDATLPWEVKGIDLTRKESKSALEDEHGHPATVIHGWLTKRNKSGIYAGQVEKERYFVLTPSALCFFPDEASADVRNGYMWGRAEGEKIGGLFTKTGARLPLESVCEVRLLAKAEDSKHAPGSPGKNSPKDARSRSRSEGSEGDGAEEEDEAGFGSGGKPKKPAAPKPTGAKPAKPPGPKPAGAASSPSPTKPPKPDGPAPSNLIEVDFGEYSLIVNAHNSKCRTAWTQGLRKWSGIRKRQVDEEMFTHMGGM